MRGFDKHLHEMLQNPEFALEYSKLFAELPLPTQLAIMRRRRKLSQRALAKKLNVRQPHIARTENARHDPRISSIVRAAKAIHCHVILVPHEQLGQFSDQEIIAIGRQIKRRVWKRHGGSVRQE